MQYVIEYAATITASCAFLAVVGRALAWLGL